MMPGMDGYEVLTKLRENPATEAIPVILLTAVPAESGELPGLNLGVEHYITKPWLVGKLEVAVRVALREAGGTNDEDVADDGQVAWQDWAFHDERTNVQEPPKLIRTGNMPLNEKLGGGISMGSLTLIVRWTPKFGQVAKRESRS